MDVNANGTWTVTSPDGSQTAIPTTRIQNAKLKGDGVNVLVWNGSLDGREVIIKVFRMKQLYESARLYNEIAALKKLKVRKCESAPEYLFDVQNPCLSDPDILEHCVVMTKVPGDTVMKVLKETPKEELEEVKSKIETAFKWAVAELHSCCVDNGSHHDENLLYDQATGRCYIVDFERSRHRYMVSSEIPEKYREISEWDLWWRPSGK